MNVSNQGLVLVHDVFVVLLVKGQALIQLILKLLVGVRQELSLALELLLDVLVDVLLLLLAVSDDGVQMLMESQLELIVVIDVLSHIVNGFLVSLQ